MTDEHLDHLIRRLEVSVQPSPDFARASLAALRPQIRAAAAADASWLGRWMRDIRTVGPMLAGDRVARPFGAMVLVGLLLLGALVGLFIVGALNRESAPANGLLIVSVQGELQAVNPANGSVRSIRPPTDHAVGVSRSPDGGLAAYWSSVAGRSRLFTVNVDGSAVRELASDLEITWAAGINAWSADSRWIASEVSVGGRRRILVADAVTGVGRFVTAPQLTAHNPLWSPDQRSIAFTDERSDGSLLATIGVDGTGLRVLSPAVTTMAGPDSWSPDGLWIYFGNTAGRAFRTNTLNGRTEPLTDPGLQAYGPTSSPDGSRIAFIVVRPDGAFDLWVAARDGSQPRRILEHAVNDGWSGDGRSVLAEWTPADRLGGLVVVDPDTAEVRVVLPFTAECQTATKQTCLSGGVGWGQPRP